MYDVIVGYKEWGWERQLEHAKGQLKFQAPYKPKGTALYNLGLVIADDYSKFDLWAEMVAQFHKEFAQSALLLIRQALLDGDFDDANRFQGVELFLDLILSRKDHNSFNWLKRSLIYFTGAENREMGHEYMAALCLDCLEQSDLLAGNYSSELLDFLVEELEQVIEPVSLEEELVPA